MRKAIRAIFVAGFLGSSVGFAQNALPIAFPAQIPETEDIELSPLSGHRDAQIVLRFIQENRAKIDRSSSAKEYLDLQRLFVGRYRITASNEEQILFVVYREGGCSFLGCSGYALTRKGNDWVELYEIVGLSGGDTARVRLATRPIEARLYNPETDKSDIATIVQPVNEGHRTIVGKEIGFYWDGARWALFCWWHECD